MKKQNIPLYAGVEEDVRALILDNLGLVKYVVGKMQIYFKKDDEEDILGYGIVGLIESAKRYDKTRGVKFNTFAVPRIRGSIVDYLRTQDLLPRSMRKKESDIKEITRAIEKKFNREPEPDEIAAELGVSVNEYHDIQTKLNFDYFVSLENLHVKSDNDQKRSISNILEDDTAKEAGKLLEEKEEKELLITLIKKLPKNERLVITLYYLEDMLIKEISATLKISESRVSQLHHKALFFLRTNMKRLHS